MLSEGKTVKIATAYLFSFQSFKQINTEECYILLINVYLNLISNKISVSKSLLNISYLFHM